MFLPFSASHVSVRSQSDWHQQQRGEIAVASRGSARVGLQEVRDRKCRGTRVAFDRRPGHVPAS